MTNKTNSKFQTSAFGGSGCYACDCCGKRTRETGRGESDNRQCAVCYESGACGNSLSDGGYAEMTGKDPWDIFEGLKTVDEVLDLFNAESAKLEKWIAENHV